MTQTEMQIVLALARCTMMPGSWDKRFIRDLAHRSVATAGHPRRLDETDAQFRSRLLSLAALELTDKQKTQLMRLAHKYRRQLPENFLGYVLFGRRSPGITTHNDHVVFLGWDPALSPAETVFDDGNLRVVPKRLDPKRLP